MEFTNSKTDYVNYQAYHRNSKIYYIYNNQACYSAIMSYLPECEVWLEPNKEESLPFDIFCYLFDRFKEHGLTPPEVVPYQKSNKNYAFIPCRGRHKYQIYATLCLYRWADSCRKLCWEFYQLLQRNDLDFYQAFHYSIAKYSISDVHSFLNVGASFYSSNTDVATKTNVAKSMALKYIIQNINEIDKECSFLETGYFNTLVDAFANKIFTEKLNFNNIEDLLSPDLKILYSVDPKAEGNAAIKEFKSNRKVRNVA